MRTARGLSGGFPSAPWAGGSPPLRVAADIRDLEASDVCRGVWRCRVSADTTVSVIRKRRLGASLAMIAIGVGILVLGVMMGPDPALMVGGGIWAAIGIDSCARVKPTSLVKLRNGSAENEVMNSQDDDLVNSFVEQISAEVAKLKALRGEHKLWKSRTAIRAKAG